MESFGSTHFTSLSLWFLNETYPACHNLWASSGLPSETAPSFVLVLSTPYYGGSVALGLASLRRSRIDARQTLVGLGPPFVSFPQSFLDTHRREHSTSGRHLC